MEPRDENAELLISVAYGKSRYSAGIDTVYTRWTCGLPKLAPDSPYIPNLVGLKCYRSDTYPHRYRSGSSLQGRHR